MAPLHRNLRGGSSQSTWEKGARSGAAWALGEVGNRVAGIAMFVGDDRLSVPGDRQFLGSSFFVAGRVDSTNRP